MSAPEGWYTFRYRFWYIFALPSTRGHLLFYSDKYQWLTVDQTGTNIQFKGTGTINGKGYYSFRIWAGDISKGWGVDIFRIRIWETTTGEVVYDNGVNQEVDGGSIKIYKK
jgi:hypothetical protein